MTRTHILVLAAASILFAGSAAAEGYRLAPYKDDLFALPKVLESGFDGDYLRVQYIEQRDLFNRDVEPQRKVSGSYVSLDTEKVEQDLVLNAGGMAIKTIGVGRISGNAKSVVIYIHGMNVTRVQGADDWMFGGNFNRIKNLMARNDGVYLSPDFSDFAEKGKSEIKALMKIYAANSPGAPIFVACGSMGGTLCWELAKDREAAKLLGGLLLLGSNHDDAFLGSAAMKARVPIYLGHGTKDTVFDWQGEAAFFQKVKGAVPGYPIKLTLFDSGAHGTPIRMSDWRLVLNWMLDVDGK
jgi:hypothetical protein